MPHDRRAALVAILMLPGLLPAGALAQRTAQNPSFNLVNRGGTPIKEFFATPAGRDNWGRDRLNGTPLAPGGKSAVRLPTDGNCVYDLRVVFTDGRAEERRNVDTCRAEDIPVGETETARRSFRLVNGGGSPVTELEARPQGSQRWLANRIAGGPIAPGASHSFALPPGGDCVFDLRVTFQGGQKREKRAADLCKSPEQEVR